MEMSPQQQHESFSRSRPALAAETKTSAHLENKRRMKFQSHRRQSAPSLVLTKALIRSRTVSRDSFLFPVFPETLPLVQSFLGPGRAFLLHGHAQLKTGLQTQDRHLFLFTDLLIVAKSKSPTNFKLKTQVYARDMWTAGCIGEVCEGSTNPDWSFVMGWPTYNCVATFSSADQKERWLSFLKSRIKEEKEKNDPKTIPLRVLGKDIGSLIPTKTIAVSNSDSANEVIRLALQQFGIAGSVRDYQLWVTSKRDNAPYPLIGHECPFSIRMSHLREPTPQSGGGGGGGGGGRDAVAPPDRQGAPHPEQLLHDKECQFILKLRRVVVATATQQQPAADPAQKPFRRRRSLINWAFWKGSASQLHDWASLTSPAAGCLFGQPLSAVCREVTLPKPVMDMMVFLYHEGAFTRGIFRRSAGAKACRELRDTLDAGAREIPLVREHVFIIAGVFKDFLRNIPGGLLCCDMYDQWMEVMEEDGRDGAEQAWAIHRLIGQLPIEHSLLLRYLIAMLHGIQGNALNNQMNAFNLSVCIAPSMLWAPGPASREAEGEGAKKVCELVRFMIEHGQQVLGDDVTSLFGGPPVWGRYGQQGPGASSLQLEDSSYDSVDNELTEDAAAEALVHPARRGRRRRVKPRQRSLDSALTLSDYEPDQPSDADDDDADDHRHDLQLSPAAPPSSGSLSPAEAAAPTPGPSPSPDGGRPRTPDPLSMGGPRRQRRSSEPAMGRLGRGGGGDGGAATGSMETLGDEDDDEEEEEEEGREEEEEGGLRPPSAPPTPSSADSLDSLLSPSPRPAGAAPPLRPGPAPPVVPSPAPSDAPPPAPPPPPFPGRGGASLKSSPPKEAVSWAALRCGRGLHPSTWLKRARRLSLQKQEEDEKKERGARQTSVDLPGSGLPLPAGPSRGGGRGARDPGPPRSPGREDPESAPPSSPSDRPLTVRELRELHSQACLLHQHSSDVISKRQPTRRDAVKKGPATGSDVVKKGQATGSDAINEGQATGSDAINESQATGSDGINEGQATGSDVINDGQATGSDASGSQCPPYGVLFYGQSGPSLSLDRDKSSPSTEGHQGRLYQRRASAPGASCPDQAPGLGLTRASASRLERLHREAWLARRLKADPGLRVSEADPQGGRGAGRGPPRFCLSSSASTRAVRDYFTSHGSGSSSPRSGQEMALALARGKRHWLRRCSDPMLEPDFDQLSFAEESYV